MINLTNAWFKLKQLHLCLDLVHLSHPGLLFDDGRPYKVQLWCIGLS